MQHVDGRIILRWIFRKLEGVVGTGWSWLRIGTGGGHLWVGEELSGSIKAGNFLTSGKVGMDWIDLAQNREGWRQLVNPYPTAFPYGNGMVLHFYQQQESSTTKTVHKVINKGLKTYV